MTSEQLKKLNVGDRVYFNGDPSDCGSVTANHGTYVIIKWDDGHRSFAGHKEMTRVELLAAKR